MRKILSSLILMLGLIVIATSATLAVFSDSDRVLGNSVAAAHLTIDAREIIQKPFTVTNMVPDEWGPNGVVELYNDGNVAQRQYMYVENISGPLCEYLELKLGYSWKATGFPHRMDHVYGVWSLWALNGPANRKEVGRDGIVNSNITTRLVQIPHLLSTTPNEMQQKGCTWNEVFVAESVVPSN